VDRALAEVSRAPSPARLRALLSPQSVAIVGASDRSGWSSGAFGNFASLGFRGALHLVNRNGGTVHGRPAVTSCTGIGEPVDLAIMLVGAGGLAPALADVAAAGIPSAVVLAAGFGETGEHGASAQQELVEQCSELGVTCVGPNCLGFVNVLDHAPAWAGMMPVRLIPGAVAIVSQSGATASEIATYAVTQNIGLSHIISTGNEAMVDAIGMASAVVEDERVRALAIFTESIRDAQRFRALAARAAELEKPIVMMKVGTSALAAEIALTHTGALVGDDRLVDTALRQCGVVRVRSLEELAITAGLLAQTGPLSQGGLGVVSISGGACDIIADRAELVGLPLPALAGATRSRLKELIPEYVTPRNPLDITGAASENPQLFADALRTIADDPSVAAVAAVHILPSEGRAERFKPRLELIAPALAAGEHGFLVDPISRDIDPFTAGVLEEVGVPYTLTGLGNSVDAIANAVRWSAWLRRPRAPTAPEGELELDGRSGHWSEARGLELLARHGVPVVPWRLAGTADEAVAAGRELGYPVVVKVVSPEILHKSDVGGVALGLQTDDDVRAAFERVTTAGSMVDGAQVEGAIVAAMRSGGLELIVGVVNDEEWGPALAVGLGGVWVHVLDDTSLRLLPVDGDEVREMLDELRGRALLDGVRGSTAADVDRVAATIAAFARLAERLGPRLMSIEINPLRVEGADIEALDAVVVWQMNGP
jgi:acetate---CoA ligase (ADP-forming)